MSTIRVLLAEDHLLVRASLRSLLESVAGVEVVAEADDGRQAIEKATEYKPDIVLMDISMPGMNGMEATRQIAKALPEVKVVVLSMHTNEDFVLQALRAGASGYVLKGSPPQELEMAIGSVARGELFLSPAISKGLISVFLSQTADRASPLDQLTPRQREILQLVAEGKSSKEIARLLNASVKTVESHRQGMMDRLNIHDVPGLVRFAIRHGLVSSDE
jgi:DNA-binding NarL/FixJ family response regulator